MKDFFGIILGNIWELIKWPLAICAGILVYAMIADWITDEVGQKRHGWDSDPCPEGCSEVPD